MISLSKITRQHGGRVLLIDANLKIDPGEKVGLVGANGSGKTSLFRMILGEETPDEGTVDRPKRLSIAAFRQDVGDWKGRTVLAETISAAGEVAVLGEQLVGLEARLEDYEAADYDQVLSDYGDVQQRFSELGGYELEARAQSILAGLGLTADQVTGDIGALSGGWKMRVALAKVLLAKPDVMLLDEPTNYLDIESILWLEQFLLQFQGAVLMTCHDSDVLNRVVKRIVEIDGGTIRSYSGDHDFYLRQRAEDAARREAEYEKQQAMLAKEVRFIERFKAQPSKASQVQSRAKKLDRIEKVEPPPRIVERHYEFRKCSRSGDDVISVKGLRKAWGERQIFKGLDWSVRRGERWAVMGANGAGKTTLLKMVTGTTEADGGTVSIGAAVQLGWYAQHQMELLTGNNTVLAELEAFAPTAGIGTLRSLAGMFQFSGDDVEKPIHVLSGGERARLVLAKLLFSAPNLLVLDEPTNHLDAITRRALVKALQAFEGTLVFVSHDRSFLRALSTRVLELCDSGPRIYPGSYDEYVIASGHEAPGMRGL